MGWAVDVPPHGFLLLHLLLFFVFFFSYILFFLFQLFILRDITYFVHQFCNNKYNIHIVVDRLRKFLSRNSVNFVGPRHSIKCGECLCFFEVYGHIITCKSRIWLHCLQKFNYKRKKYIYRYDSAFVICQNKSKKNIYSIAENVSIYAIPKPNFNCNSGCKVMNSNI